MSWYRKARDVVVRFGPSAGTAIKHIAGIVPGGSVVGALVESALHQAADTGQQQIEAETALKNLATANDLERLSNVFEECLGRLGKLVEVVQLHEDEPADAIQKLIVAQLATDQQVREGFAQLGTIVQRFDQVEAKLDRIIQEVGYAGDLQAAFRLLLQQQSAVVSFFEDVRAAGVSGKQFAGAIRRMNGAMGDLYEGRVPQAAIALNELEREFPLSAAVAEAEAIQLVLVNEPARAGERLSQASRRRPDDARLANLSRRVTLATGSGKVDTDTGRPVADWRQHFQLHATVDGWTITGRLGEGGMGSVYRVEKGKEVRALKVLSPALSQDPAFSAQFRKEILTLSGLGGLAHVVQFHDFGWHKAADCWFFQMEYVAGESLQTKLDRAGPLGSRI